MAAKKDHQVSLTIAGEDFGLWDEYTGGALTREVTKHTPADGIQDVYVGNPTRDDITLVRTYKEARDGQIEQREDELSGELGTVLRQDRDINGTLQKNLKPIQGIVSSIQGPESDSNDASRGTITIVVSPGAVRST